MLLFLHFVSTHLLKLISRWIQMAKKEYPPLFNAKIRHRYLFETVESRSLDRRDVASSSLFMTLFNVSDLIINVS